MEENRAWRKKEERKENYIKIDWKTFFLRKFSV